MSFVRTQSPPRARWALAATAAACAAFAAWVLIKAWTADDAYITFRVCDNWRRGFGPCFNPAERVQVFTHPLWMFLMTAAATLTHDYYYTSVFLGWALSLLAVGVLVRLADAPPAAAAVVTILAASRAFTDYSTSGLENPLTHALLALFAAAVLRPGGPRVRAVATLAALVMVTRLDAGWLVLPAVAWTAWLRRSRRTAADLVLGFAPLWGWGAFSLFYYGAVLPNSALAKLATGIPVPELVRQGGDYFVDSLRHDPVTLPGIALALGVAMRRVAGAGRALGAGVVLYLAWVLCIGGDFMSGRFFTAPFFVAVVLLARSRLRPVPVALLACAAAVTGAIAAAGSGLDDSRYRTRWQEMVPRHGIVDERMFYEHKTALRHARGRWDWPQPDAVAEAVRLRNEWWRDDWSRTLKAWGVVDAAERWPPGAKADARGRLYQPLVVRGSIGYLAFYLGPEVHVLDYYALADPLLARLPAAPWDPALDALLPRMAGRRWRIGHFLRCLPAGYVESVLTGENRVRDTDLARVYADIHCVTRAPLFDRRRFAALRALHGGDRAVLRAYAARAPSPQAAPMAPGTP